MPVVRGNAREVKAQALALLEWALEDMSPTGSDKLHFKCGFEREGHFVANDPECTDCGFMDKKADDMAERVGKSPELAASLREIYHDAGGTFILEAVTKPLGLLEATKAVDNISNAMLQKAPELGFTEYGFGSVPATCVDRLLAHHHGDDGAAIKDFVNYQGEVFNLPDQGKTLVGRGTHCNLSLWLGDKELSRRQGSSAGSTDIIHHAAKQTMEWMPSMFLPCRKGNYHRIAAGTKGAAQQFLAADLSGVKAAFMLRYTADSKFRGYREGSFRLEFRAGAAEADPYDVALAAAAPLVKACDEALLKQDGRIITNQQGHPVIESQCAFPSQTYGDVPKNEASATALFNVPNNPYFEYLDKLAARKITRMQEIQAASPSPINAEHVRDAEKLRGIGSDLFQAYCQEYGLKPCISPAGKLRN